ncbi:MAG: NUDIX domain-containing protein [Flavobacteriales bacterium]|nr:NUDIX domain-containing protein [Flavobacteriales bacterium]MCX7768779.1 NUDIX domain-containing protein [Flavobacteriales bacterium]MDW8409427.1 NUDIX domain-containing protein [Flavobacteriales bacterium]
MRNQIKLFVGRSYAVFSENNGGLSAEEGFAILDTWLKKPTGKDQMIQVHLDPERFTEVLKQFGFNYSRAAGGLVFGPEKGLWLIRRWGFWDLPKGKCEYQEEDDVCALREVKEECSLMDVRIERFAANTYHAFSMHNKKFVKRTAWFIMSSRQQWAKPQVEEDIEEVRLVPLNDLPDYMPEMHLNLQYLLKETFPELMR